MHRRCAWKFYERRAAEDHSYIAGSSARGGIIESGAASISIVVEEVMILNATEVSFTGGFDGVLAREDVARPAPGRGVEVVVGMVGVDGHGVS